MGKSKPKPHQEFSSIGKPSSIYHDKYVAEGGWRCEKSPTKAHHWIVNAKESKAKCKYCDEERKLNERGTIDNI